MRQPPKFKTRLTLTALENGEKRKLVWIKGGELSGDEHMKLRFQRIWDATDQEAYRLSLDKRVRSHFRVELAAHILRYLCNETLLLERAQVSTPEELQRVADVWNGCSDGCIYTADDVRLAEEENIQRSQTGPPYSWSEIEEMLTDAAQPCEPPPMDHPKCPECLLPMEWIWFSSPTETWDMLCGRAGWTAVCRPCKSWRPCRVAIMN